MKNTPEVPKDDVVERILAAVKKDMDNLFGLVTGDVLYDEEVQKSIDRLAGIGITARMEINPNYIIDNLINEQI